MVNLHTDQAEGLRRMLAFSRARTIAVVAGTRGAGATSCVVNLAAALTQQGTRVLVVDENFDANVALAMGLRVRHDLRAVMVGECAMQDALVAGESGILLLAAATAARALPRLDMDSQARAVECFAELDELADIVLLDARNDGEAPSPFAAAAQEVMVVVSPGQSSITGGYAAVKRMSRTHGRKHFRLLVNRAGDYETVQTIESNMRAVAQRHLDVTLETIGSIPLDPSVVLASRRFASVLHALPSAAAARGFRELAATVAAWAAPQFDASRLDIFMQRAISGSRHAARAGV